METSKTFGICYSHKFLNTNKSPICLFKISIISFFRILLENKSLPLRTHPILKVFQGFPGGTVVENLPANAGDTGSSPGLGRSHLPQSN